MSDHLLLLIQLQIPQEIQRLSHTEITQLHNVLAAYGNGQNFRAKPPSMAVRAFHRAHAEGDFFPNPVGLGVPEPPFQIRNYALKNLAVGTGTKIVAFGKSNGLISGTVQDHILHRFRQFLKGSIQRKAVVLGQSFVVHLRHTEAKVPAAGFYRILPDGQGAVRHHQIRVHLHKGAQSGAGGASPGGVVKGKQIGFRFGHGNVVLRASVIQAVQPFLLPHNIHQHHPAGKVGGGFQAVIQTRLNFRLHYNSVHNDFDVVLFILFRKKIFSQIIDGTVNPHPDIAAAPGGIQHLFVGTFSSPHHRRHNLKFGLFRQRQKLIHNLIDGLTADLPAAHRAVGSPHPGIEQPEIVVNFGDGAYGGAGVFGGGFLIDGDGRAEPFNGLHIGLLHLPQKLPGIGGNTLHIPALAVGVDGIKGQAGFTGTGKPGKDDKLISWDG